MLTSPFFHRDVLNAPNNHIKALCGRRGSELFTRENFAMSDKAEIVAPQGLKVSRRDLFQTATVMAGGAAALMITEGKAIARTSDVVMDSSGRVLIDGVVHGREDAPLHDATEAGEERVQVAACLNGVCRSRIPAKRRAARCANGLCRGHQRK
jgi:hypothetical protein